MTLLSIRHEGRVRSMQVTSYRDRAGRLLVSFATPTAGKNRCPGGKDFSALVLRRRDGGWRCSCSEWPGCEHVRVAQEMA